MEIIIRDRWTGDPIYTARDVENLCQALTEAIGSRANLYGADLSRANLYGANLYGADLYGADLYGANLSGANLSRANLSGANLSRADLYGANLYRANLYGANLSRANLYGADLSGADLSGADLSGADLYGADLSGANLSGAKGIRGILNIGPIGSRSAYLTAIRKDDLTIEIWTGCFRGTITEFKNSARATHDDNRHGLNYRSAIALIEAFRWDDELEIENKTADFAEGQAKEKMMEV